MARHVLSLEAPDTLNKCILPIYDTSVYNTDVEVECPLLEITLPGFAAPVQLSEADDVRPGFSFNFTACDLGVQVQNCGTQYASLPDGIYVIRYSVSPNEYVYVEYNHLRITNALDKYNKILCELDIADCDPPKEIENKLKELHKIRMYLDAAKAKVEYCHEPKKGMELYKYAVKLLSKFTCNTCNH